MNRIERARLHETLTLREACEYFRVSEPTLRGALRRGEVYGQKIGRQWRIWRFPPKEGLKTDAELERLDGAAKNAAPHNEE
ncbi:MAG: helix-turn-helix domain-containing protein [Thermoguttaceae bacterium]|nr:helix-turn-helix domain-containing protein [Thermoguttaceae bacterium]